MSNICDILSDCIRDFTALKRLCNEDYTIFSLNGKNLCIYFAFRRFGTHRSFMYIKFYKDLLEDNFGGTNISLLIFFNIIGYIFSQTCKV